MKSYRYLVLAVLVAAITGGWVSLVHSNAVLDEQYQAHLADARAAAELGVTADVRDGFSAALAIRPSVEVSMELADYLRDNATPDVYEDELERLIARYPDRPEGYARLAAIHIEDEELREAFEVLDKARSREVESEEIAAQYASIAYRYRISGGGYPDVTPFTADDVAGVAVDDSWRFVDAKGMAIEGAFDEVGAFYGGQGAVVRDGLAQYVDEDGETTRVATRLDHQSYGILAEGILPALTRDGSYTYLTDSFRPTTFPGPYTSASSFVGGRAAVASGGSWSVIDTTGAAVGEGYAEVAVDASGIAVGQERYFAKVGAAFQLFDVDGQRVGSGEFADARPFSASGFAAVQVGDAWGFVDATGQVRIEPRFDDAQSFAHGLAAVRVGDLWGYADESGAVVIEPAFLDASAFSSQGTALVGTSAENQSPALAPDPGTAPEPGPQDPEQAEIVWRLLELVRYRR